MKEIAKDEEKQKQKDKMTEERSQEVKTYEMIFLLYFDSFSELWTEYDVYFCVMHRLSARVGKVL